MAALVRIFEAEDPLRLARARTILDVEGIPYLVEGENYAVAAGGWAFGGDVAVWISVPATVAERATQALADL